MSIEFRVGREGVDRVLVASRSVIAVSAQTSSPVNGDLTLPEMRSLEVLATEGPQTVEALTERLSASVSPSRLVALGLAVRVASASDHHIVLVLSTGGRCLVDHLRATASQDSDRVRYSPRRSQ